MNAQDLSTETQLKPTHVGEGRHPQPDAIIVFTVGLHYALILHHKIHSNSNYISKNLLQISASFAIGFEVFVR